MSAPPGIHSIPLFVRPCIAQSALYYPDFLQFAQKIPVFVGFGASVSTICSPGSFFNGRLRRSFSNTSCWRSLSFESCRDKSSRHCETAIQPHIARYLSNKLAGTSPNFACLLCGLCCSPYRYSSRRIHADGPVAAPRLHVIQRRFRAAHTGLQPLAEIHCAMLPWRGHNLP